MSKVFSAKRKTVEFEYEFLDGKTATMVVRSLSTKEQTNISSFKSENIDDAIKNYKKILGMQLANNNNDLVKKIIDEQFEDGDLVEFSNSLGELISQEKAKK